MLLLEGPAKAACAIQLKREAQKGNKDIRAILFEGKAFSVHYNQCIGVFSPPLLTLLKEELELALPAGLIKNGLEDISCIAVEKRPC